MHRAERLHALDAVRAFALIAGIVLHGTMSFLPDLASLGFPIADRSQSLTLEVAYYVIHIFRMSLFFLIAGFFAHLLFHREGFEGFVRDRARRIAAPMLLTWPVSTLLIVLAIGWALSKGDGLPAPTGPRPQESGIPLTHLWFLYYLLLFYALTLIAREIVVRLFDRNGGLRSRVDSAMRALVSGPVAPVVFALPVAATLYARPEWIWVGIPTPEYGLTPRLTPLVSYGTAFVFGWLLHRQTALLSVFEERWRLHLILAMGASAAAWFIVGAPMKLNAVVPDDVKLAYAALYAFAAWEWMFAVIGAALTYFAAPSPMRRYFADASYWMYLVHVPLLFALQTAMMQWPLHWMIKFPLLMLVTLVILLASYHWLVRSTIIGEYLNGRRYPREWPSPDARRSMAG